VVTIIDRTGKQEKLAKMPKFDVANAILDRVKKFMENRSTTPPGR